MTQNISYIGNLISKRDEHVMWVLVDFRILLNKNDI